MDARRVAVERDVRFRSDGEKMRWLGLLTMVLAVGTMMWKVRLPAYVAVLLQLSDLARTPFAERDAKNVLQTVSVVMLAIMSVVTPMTKPAA